MSVKILNEIDVSEYEWCNSAIMFRVHNGIGTITHKLGKEDEDYGYNAHLLINDKPILQTYQPICPTCKGMLATGYGIENIDCSELKAVRECLNNNYINIRHSAEMLKPLLNLLEDGYYLLADVPHYPTDSNDTFFWSVPNEMTYNDAFCDEYYNDDLRNGIQGFPAYLYPTQSAEMCSEKRVDEYIEILKNNPNPPRALAYHEYGFISALLDGHHKATASAILGREVRCLTIIKQSGFIKEWDKKRTSGIEIGALWFADISISAENIPYIEKYCYSLKPENHVHNLKCRTYSLTGRSFPEAEKNASLLYPDIRTLADMHLVKFEKSEFTDEILNDFIKKVEYDKLIYSLAYLMVTDREMAYNLAIKIVNTDNMNFPIEKAWRVLLQFKDEKTEKLFIDYIVNHTKNDRFWNIVTSYWD
ncbi:MAG: hypothetical protein NC040_05515 [Muribaculaceae bacterium]|nr:hypothetical protein [Alistipes senegalensis]MCM1473493.1 hypothetical protein [Muribaculaceae bacterium]